VGLARRGVAGTVAYLHGLRTYPELPFDERCIFMNVRAEVLIVVRLPMATTADRYPRECGAERRPLALRSLGVQPPDGPESSHGLRSAPGHRSSSGTRPGRSSGTIVLEDGSSGSWMT